MNDVSTYGVQRIKAAIFKFSGDFRIADIVTEALIGNGYDIDIEPINDEFHRPQGEKINVYTVKR
ncbi:hypothetical protein B2H84_03135 [Clostridium botulinum]|uniref:hypothetical protein n=1 Tax=Clostridium botulinum TaxID=1491 RepID=UPI000A174919|nr:hypothetical protein [Clostridium botulinum]OSA84096.1 hypothetical protein B2H84_03135 [Clostridium botulinum]